MAALKASDLRIGEDVIVTNDRKRCAGQIGTVWKIDTSHTPPRISVSFEGEIFRYDLCDLDLA